VLLLTASADALCGSPSTRRDALYFVMGVGLGASALWERRALPQGSSTRKAGSDEQRRK